MQVTTEDKKVDTQLCSMSRLGFDYSHAPYHIGIFQQKTVRGHIEDRYRAEVKELYVRYSRSCQPAGFVVLVCWDSQTTWLDFFRFAKA